MVAAGNDFVLLDTDSCGVPDDVSGLAVWACRPHSGIGADGLILLRRDGPDRLGVTVVNPDGSIAKMCGNGARCAAYYAFATGTSGPLTVELGRHTMRAWSRGGLVEVTSPEPDRIGGPVRLATKEIDTALDLYTVDTGTPYAVAIVPDADALDVNELGRFVRYHPHFAPDGLSVSVAQVRDDGLAVRTYERGNEEETLSCGSGAVACVAVARSLGLVSEGTVAAHTRSGTPLLVRIAGDAPPFGALTLTGPAEVVFEGTFTGPAAAETPPGVPRPASPATPGR
ncbi:diaminopimelate epimerase [Actinocrispum wychmicini]|uniref:Diaminopimelate epimerase n=2 Tax=Actinocrispum wychmicini TaxID=1213861 RepID=A0A4V2S7P7_9PSEU|nr:diaminopimelate epimerase [Actinocrispum wychmicini]